jgi:hypothetical protein
MKFRRIATSLFAKSMVDSPVTDSFGGRILRRGPELVTEAPVFAVIGRFEASVRGKL